MHHKAVSVVVPCFNAEAYLGEAITSILAQDYPSLEIIVVNDGSTDDSADVARSFGDRITYLEQSNQGISSARNTALKRCSGDYISFLDADDLWPPDSVTKRLDALSDNEAAGYVYGNVEQFLSPELDEETRRSIYCPGDAQAGRLAGSIVARKEAAELIGFFDEALPVGETLDWVDRAGQLGVKSICIDSIVLRRRLHTSNTVATHSSTQQAYLKVLKATLDRRRTESKAKR